MISQTTPSKFKPYTRQTIFLARQWQWLRADLQEAVQVVSHVLPFRTNQYVLDQLIDWDKVEDDPIYRLTFPHRDMLPAEEYEQLRELVLFKRNDAATAAAVRRIRARMNPHPAGQVTHNVPRLDGVALRGLQHKYAQTVQFFPSAAQACHAHCTYCSRWPQFVTMDAMKFQAHASNALVAYLRAHPEVTDVLITGGDPLVMPASALAECIEPLLAPELAHIRSIRIGTKSVAYWPHRFVTDPDSDDLLRLFERVAASGKSLAVMGHYSHAVELRNEVAQQAVRRIVASGAELRMQGPLVRHVNDDPATWAELWSTGQELGAIPGYMFVERDTGPQDYFKVPLARAHAIFLAACQAVPGLAGGVNGPSMSTHAGRVGVDGIDTIDGEKVFALRFLEARNRDWVGRRFFARFDPGATWIDELAPAFGEKAFFFESGDAAGAAVPNGRVIPIARALELA
ncbi:MAG: 4Fe-4S cluster-binding protein [Massilia sp.]|nr:4Fe-4S cluster-binding protein [Massilia sp.]MDB5791633.1 4Fe-4S cluster-binding protein [Massilia sp.]